MCKVRNASHETEQNCPHSRLQPKYLRTGTLGRQKPNSENSLILNVSSGTQLHDVGWIHPVRGEKARESSWEEERLSVSQRGVRSKRLFTYIIPHFSYLHLIDYQRQPLTCPIFNENPAIPSTRAYDGPHFVGLYVYPEAVCKAVNVYSYRSRFRYSVLLPR
jgi:hypothetical protein